MHIFIEEEEEEGVVGSASETNQPTSTTKKRQTLLPSFSLSLSPPSLSLPRSCIYYQVTNNTRLKSPQPVT